MTFAVFVQAQADADFTGPLGSAAHLSPTSARDKTTGDLRLRSSTPSFKTTSSTATTSPRSSPTRPSPRSRTARSTSSGKNPGKVSSSAPSDQMGRSKCAVPKRSSWLSGRPASLSSRRFFARPCRLHLFPPSLGVVRHLGAKTRSADRVGAILRLSRSLGVARSTASWAGRSGGARGRMSSSWVAGGSFFRTFNCDSP